MPSDIRHLQSGELGHLGFRRHDDDDLLLLLFLLLLLLLLLQLLQGCLELLQAHRAVHLLKLLHLQPRGIKLNSAIFSQSASLQNQETSS